MDNFGREEDFQMQMAFVVDTAVVDHRDFVVADMAEEFVDT